MQDSTLLRAVRGFASARWRQMGQSTRPKRLHELRSQNLKPKWELFRKLKTLFPDQTGATAAERTGAARACSRGLRPSAPTTPACRGGLRGLGEAARGSTSCNPHACGFGARTCSRSGKCFASSKRLFLSRRFELAKAAAPARDRSRVHLSTVCCD